MIRGRRGASGPCSARCLAALAPRVAATRRPLVPSPATAPASAAAAQLGINGVHVVTAGEIFAAAASARAAKPAIFPAGTYLPKNDEMVVGNGDTIIFARQSSKDAAYDDSQPFVASPGHEFVFRLISRELLERDGRHAP